MIKMMEQGAKDGILAVADLMMTAALTAPKGSGRDTIVAAVVAGEDKDRLRDATLEFGNECGEAFVIRDAGNIDRSECVVLIGCKSQPFGLANCHMCGFENCAEMKKAGTNCVFNVTDLGIAIGSAVSVAADHRIDNRVMYSAGKGALRLGIFPDNVRIIYGIPLSANSKSIYFDRAPGAVLL